MERSLAIDQFYLLLDNLQDRLGGKRKLAISNGRMDWPNRGLYFFFENGEQRGKNQGLRVVRVGTHAVSRGSKTTLWDRLRTHRGRMAGAHKGGGNHRGSIFRLHVGSAILNRDNLRDQYQSWGKGSSAPKAIRDFEQPIEKLVSDHIRSMPFLWLKVDDPPGKESVRKYLERNAISLLSNYGKLGPDGAIDPPSPNWLGLYCENDFVRRSGLWNVQHVTDQTWDVAFLGKLEEYIRIM